jgi:hypothetical protein
MQKGMEGLEDAGGSGGAEERQALLFSMPMRSWTMAWYVYCRQRVVERGEKRRRVLGAAAV